VPRIGALGGGVDADSPGWAGFRQGLRELGWEEGRNVAVEFRFTGDRVERYRELAGELVRWNVDVLAAENSQSVRAVFLREIAPGMRRVAVVWNPNNPGSAMGQKHMESLAQRFGLHFISVPVRQPEDLERALTTLARERPDALHVHPRSLRDRTMIAEFALSTACQVSPDSALGRKQAFSCPTGPTYSIRAVGLPNTWTGSSRVPSRLISPSSNLRNSSW
jgi:hypothetical protein